MQVDPVQAIMQLVGWLDPSLTNRAITVAVVSPRMIDAWCRGQFRRRLISENGDSFEQQVLHHINQLVV